MIRGLFAIIVLVGVSLLPGLAVAQQNDPAWNNLSELTHRASMTFITQERKCVTGFLKSVSDTSVIVKVKNGKATTIQRPDLLRVQLNWYGSPILFSGRSSWADVAALAAKQHPQLHPRIIVETRTGQKNEGTLINASDEGLTLQSHDGRADISKSDVVRVTSIVQKPVSDSAAYADDELVFLKVLDPELWPATFRGAGCRSASLCSMPHHPMTIPKLLAPTSPNLRWEQDYWRNIAISLVIRSSGIPIRNYLR